VGGRLDPAVARARVAVRACLADLDPDDLVLVGCSGGADSLALLVAACFEAEHSGVRVGAIAVDHGLQPGSADVAHRAAAQAADLGAEPVRVERVHVGTEAGPEGAARTARHAALGRAVDDLGARCALLAHTRDDQAETVLLGLSRGSGGRSLAGMRPVSGWLRRPLLGLTRADTEQVCRASGLTWWDDPHNIDDAHARVRVRRHLLPALERALGPGVRDALARTADLLRADADALDDLAAELLVRAGTPDDLGVDVLLAAPGALRRRALRSAALAAGCPATDLVAGHVAAIDALLTDWHGQRGVDLPARVRATREGDRLRLVARVPG